MDQGLLAEMETLSSAKGQAMIAWSRAGGGTERDTPIKSQRTRDKSCTMKPNTYQAYSQYLLSRRQTQNKSLGISLPMAPERPVLGLGNIQTRQPFPGGMTSGKLSHTIQLLHFL